MKAKTRRPVSVIIAALAAFALVFALTPAIALAAGWADGLTPNPSYAFSGGTGAEDMPYLVSSAADLEQLAVNVNVGTDYNGTYFQLTTDIDLDGSGWTPIGTGTHMFKGTFDGNSLGVQNLSINNTSGDYQGLFGRTSGAMIENLSVTGDVHGHAFVGLLVGEADADTSIHYCSASGTVTATDIVAGGLVGNYGDSLSTILGSTADVDVTGTRFVGGLVGYCNYVHVTQSGATGTVTASNDESGGLVGLSNRSVFEQDYALGAVTGEGDVGGFVGSSYADGPSDAVSTFTNCYAKGSAVSTFSGYGWCAGSFIGEVTDSDLANCYGSGIAGCTADTGYYIGGFAGEVDDDVSFTACYFDSDKNGSAAAGHDEGESSPAVTGVTGLPTAKMQGTDALDSGKMDALDTGAGAADGETIWYAVNGQYPGFNPEPRLVVVTFQSNGGSFVPSLVVRYDDNITPPPDPTRAHYLFDDWYANAALTTPFDFVTKTGIRGDITIFAKWNPLLELTASPASGYIYTGGRITITPSIAGGEWEFDSAYLSRDGNTFTGLQVGTTRVTYASPDEQTAYMDVVISEAQLPTTGQDFTPALQLLALAALTGGLAIAMLMGKRRRQRAR